MWKILVVSILAVLLLRQDTDALTTTCPTNVTSNNYVGSTNGIIQVRTDPEANVATVIWDPPVVTNNISRFNVTSSPYNSGDKIPVAALQIITFTATESSGGTDTCFLVISVIDIEDPICIIDPPSYIGSAEMGKQNSTINYVITVRDNVQVSNINTDYSYIDIGSTGKEYIVDSAMEEINSTGTFASGVTLVQFSVVDNASPNGNEGTCSFCVTINDTDAITVTCPTNVTSNNYVGFTSGIVQVRTDPGASVATVTWDTPVVTNDGSAFNVTSSPYSSGDKIPISAIHEIKFTATDSSGDTDRCVFAISVIDIEDPICTIDPPSYIGSAEMGKQTSTINFVITVRDNVQVSSIKTDKSNIDIGNSGQEYIVDSAIAEINSTGSFFIGKTMVQFSVVDNASPNGNEGNCLFGVTIKEFMTTTERAVTEDRHTKEFMTTTERAVTEDRHTEEFMPTNEKAVTERLVTPSEGPGSGHQHAGSLSVIVLMLLINSFAKIYNLN